MRFWTHQERGSPGAGLGLPRRTPVGREGPRLPQGSCPVCGPVPRGHAATAVRLSVSGAAWIHRGGPGGHGSSGACPAHTWPGCPPPLSCRQPALRPLPLPGAVGVRGPVCRPPAGYVGLGRARPGSQRAGVRAGQAGPRAPRDGTRPGQMDIPARACGQQDVAVPAGSPICLPPGPLGGQES